MQEARAGGQSVFLSSHILSEVEALCDRVAILREGRLVEIGTLEQLRHLSALTVEVLFDNEPPRTWRECRVWSAPRSTGAGCGCRSRARSSR